MIARCPHGKRKVTAVSPWRHSCENIGGALKVGVTINVYLRKLPVDKRHARCPGVHGGILKSPTLTFI